MYQHEFENEIEVKVMVKFNYFPGYPAKYGEDPEPGCPSEHEDIEIIALPFEEQPKDVQRYILEQCDETVKDARDYSEELKAEAHWDKIKDRVA